MSLPALSMVLKTDSIQADVAFLQSPCPTRAQGLVNMSPLERAWYLYAIRLTPLHEMIPWMAGFPQKSVEWLACRYGRMTGSAVAPAVGHHIKTKPLKLAIDTTKAFDPKDPSQVTYNKATNAMDWGSGSEPYAAQCYINDLQTRVTAEFRRQRLAYHRDPTTEGKPMMFFMYRNEKIPILNIHADPIVELKCFNLVTDYDNHWRSCSPDGVVVINGLAVGCIEIKCPFAKGHSVPPLMPSYYYDQLMCELYMMRMYFYPHVRWIDMITWSPSYFTVDPYILDTDYFYNWYAPRELRFFFQAYLPKMAQTLRNEVLVLARKLSIMEPQKVADLLHTHVLPSLSSFQHPLITKQKNKDKETEEKNKPKAIVNVLV